MNSKAATRHYGYSQRVNKVLMILRLSFRELLRSHIIWAALSFQVGLSLLMVPIAEVGFDEVGRIYDTLSYFAVCFQGVVVAAFLGSFLWARDSSKTGIGEIFCRADFGRYMLLCTRLFAYSLALLAFGVAGLLFYGVGLRLFAPERLNTDALLYMALYGFVLNFFALVLSCFLATLTRPAFAGLAAIFLLAAGSLAESLSGVSNLSQGDLQVISPAAVWLNIVARAWRPQTLIVGQKGGQWLLPSNAELSNTLIWASGWILVLMVALYFVLLLRDPQERVS
jgi:hypothetical protein